MPAVCDVLTGESGHVPEPLHTEQVETDPPEQRSTPDPSQLVQVLVYGPLQVYVSVLEHVLVILPVH